MRRFILILDLILPTYVSCRIIVKSRRCLISTVSFFYQFQFITSLCLTGSIRKNENTGFKNDVRKTDSIMYISEGTLMILMLDVVLCSHHEFLSSIIPQEDFRIACDDELAWPNEIKRNRTILNLNFEHSMGYKKFVKKYFSGSTKILSIQ